MIYQFNKSYLAKLVNGFYVKKKLYLCSRNREFRTVEFGLYKLNINKIKYKIWNSLIENKK